jgi:hypothetical protein
MAIVALLDAPHFALLPDKIGISRRSLVTSLVAHFHEART